MLIDESESLKTTDAQSTRVSAVHYLLDQLSSFVDTSSVTLDVRFAVFGDAYTPLNGWTALGSANLPGLQSVAATLADRNSGFDTDYWTALENSRRELADRKAARAGAPTCQAIAWFTDGLLDFGIRTNGYQRDNFPNKQYAPDITIDSEAKAVQVVGIARELICTPGGLADQLRSSDVEMFAIGLQSGGLDFGLVNSIATGPGCGAIVDPVPGLFTMASDIDGLLFAFDALGRPGEAAIHTESGICQISTCSEETHRFVLDESTPTVHILASAEVGGLNISLIAPTGETISLEPKTVDETSTAQNASAATAYSWHSDKTVSIDLSEVAPGGWSGLWQLAFVDPTGSSADKKSFSNVRISSDFVPVVVGPATDKWFRDDTLELQLGIADASGRSVDVSTLLGELALDATFVDAKGKRTEIASGLDKTTISEPLDIDLKDVAIGEATLELDLVHTTAAVTGADGAVVEPGTELQPQNIEIRIPVEPPLDFPSTQSTVNFGTLEGGTTVETTIRLEGEGCIWLDSTTVELLASPAEAGAVTVTSPTASSAADCRTGVSLPVVLTLDSSANGTVNGSFDVMLSPSGESERAIPATVTFTADLRKPFNEAIGTGAFLVALVLGIGIPLGLVYLLKFVIAKIPSRALLSQRISVTVSGERVLREGATFALRDTDLTDLTGIKPGGARSLDLAGVSLSTRIGLWPSRAGYVVVDAPGFVSASDQTPAWVSRKAPRARLPLAVHNHWIVLRSPGGPADQAEVILFVSGDADSDRKQSLVEHLNDHLPVVLERLVEAGGDTPSEGPVDEWGSGERATSNVGAGFDIDPGYPSGPSGPAPGGNSPSSGSSSGFGFDD
ncbi:hypothetical protein GCM10007382_19620 [Salinibacterium xinjiangense]|nr:hypothetical protein GCM10007382_19620 [Salinibacterium xinjiangense]